MQRSTAKLKLIVNHRAGPSANFIGLTRNMELAKRPPVRFEPTTKREGDIVL